MINPKQNKKMKIPIFLTLSLLICNISILDSISFIVQAQNSDKFLQCSESAHHHLESSQLIYSPQNSSYTSTFLSGIQNLRFLSPKMSKPSFIFTPVSESQIHPLILCSKSNGFQIRVRSGGHDYEGLSYRSKLPFVLIDLKNLSSVEIDVETRVAWIGGGVRLGQFYYELSEKSPNLGFSAGMCPTVGVGGHFSGGAFGTISRKYGLAADNILDAKIVNVDGKILDRKSMGEDLFWAIRGGGAASFGVVTAWKIGLVPVPDIVTVFTINKALDQNATELLHRWQYIADKFDHDLYVRVVVTHINSTGNTPIQAVFDSVFLGNAERLLQLMQESFPELGLVREDCTEMSWIESVLYFADLSHGSILEDLVRESPYPKTYFKIKSDFVTSPIPKQALDNLWQLFTAEEARDGRLMFAPHGGRMSDVSEIETPFPHRDGNIYDIQYMVFWDEEGNGKAERYVNWIRDVYDYMTPFVSKNPRAAYLNYRDLDLGVNNEGNTSYEQASVWGMKYFKNNFERLVRVKTEVDPDNFFRSEQSIPIFSDVILEDGEEKGYCTCKLHEV